jgi:hypothetical protein
MAVFTSLWIPAVYADSALRVGLGSATSRTFEESELNKVHSVEFQLSDGVSGTIVLDLVDIYIDSKGARRLSPLGSTPYSPQGLIEILNQDLPYQPTEELQTVSVDFKFSDQVDLDSPLIGGIRLRVESEAQNESQVESGITLQVGAVNVVTYLPTGYSVSDLMNNETNLKILNFDLFLSKQESIIYRFLPNFSFLLNSKNLGVNFRFINSGEFFLSTNNEITLKKIQLLRPDQSEVIFTNKTNTSVLMPGEVVDKNVPFEIDSAAQQRKFNAIEQYGFYRLEMNTTGSLAGTEVVGKSTTRHFLVFPWKIIFITLFLLGLFYLFNQYRSRKQPVTHPVEIEPELISLVAKKVKPKPKKDSRPVATKRSSRKAKPASARRKAVATKKKSVTTKRKPVRQQIATKKPVAKKRIAEKAPVKKKVKARV